MDNTLLDSQPAFSAITEIELLCWKSPAPEDLQVLNQFIANAFVFELEKDIKTKTAELRKTNSIKLPDAIIAATALIHDLTLISRNAKDFKNISDLKFLNPFDL